MAQFQQKVMVCAPQGQLEWGFGGRRKIRDGALLIAFFIGGIGAGQFIVSTWVFTYPLSAVIGLLCVAIGKGTAHLVYLGRPMRFFRILLKPKTSWISRGLISLIILIVFGFAYLAPYLAPMVGVTWTAWTMTDTLGQTLLAIATITAFIVMVYDGLVLNSCKSISSWHTMLMPVMFFAYSVAGGLALTTLTIIIDNNSMLGTVDIVTMDKFLLGAMLALLVLYLINLYTSDLTAKESLHRLLMSRTAIFFVGLALIAGLAVPIALTIIHQGSVQGTVAIALLAASAILELMGDLSVRHSILRAGLYTPVL